MVINGALQRRVIKVARINNLTNFLTDVATAIKTKKGDSTPIPASNFDTEINNLPSGGSGIDWSTIGYSEMPKSIQDGYDYAKEIYDNWDSTENNMSAMFIDNRKIIIMPLVDTSNVTNMVSCFYGAYGLIEFPLLNTGSVTNMADCFRECRALQSIPLINTSNVTSMQRLFSNCYALTTIPLLNTSSITGNGLSGIFTNCRELTDTSLDNILQMCVNATGYTGTKTLNTLGVSSKNIYPVSRIQALPHYQNFINAGWTIGY